LAKQVQEADRTETEVNDLRREWMVDVQGELRSPVQPPLPMGPVNAGQLVKKNDRPAFAPATWHHIIMAIVLI
jgi:hypothetical protein